MAGVQTIGILSNPKFGCNGLTMLSLDTGEDTGEVVRLRNSGCVTGLDGIGSGVKDWATGAELKWISRLRSLAVSTLTPAGHRHSVAELLDTQATQTHQSKALLQCPRTGHLLPQTAVSIWCSTRERERERERESGHMYVHTQCLEYNGKQSPTRAPLAVSLPALPLLSWVQQQKQNKKRKRPGSH